MSVFNLRRVFGRKSNWTRRNETNPPKLESEPLANSQSVDRWYTNNHSQEERPNQSVLVPSDVSGDPEAIRGSTLMSHSSQSNPPSSNASTVSDQLYEALCAARIEDPLREYHFFIPESAKNEIITKAVIAQGLRTAYPNLDAATIDESAEVAHSCAKNLFAILAYIRKPDQILDCLRENVLDKDLPLERDVHRGKYQFSLKRKNGGDIIQVFENWDSSEDREAFSQYQWLMLAPFFEDKKHYKLHINTVLPFIYTSNEQLENAKHSRGRYSEVFFTQIHNSHYWEPKSQHLNVAIKRLLTKNEAEFKNERDILKKLSSKPQPHIVALLASYQINGEFFLIFPRAKCNLRNYWEMNPNPTFDSDTIFWSLEQMMGIARALIVVHGFRVSFPREHKKKRSSSQRAFKLSVSPKEAKHGRHGDIKPENIMFFEQGAGYTSNPRGVLQITDFGLGRFHGHDSKTEQWPHQIFGSPTYEPPECKLCRPVSRVYDLWSLGCLYLEFATWLLKGVKGIEVFSDRRAKSSSDSPAMSDDLFFTITKDVDNAPVDARIREGVEAWVNELHQHPRCSIFIHDLLDLVMKDLLCIDATDRTDTLGLCSRFKTFRDNAVSSEEYLCTGRPRESSNPNTDAIGDPPKPSESVKNSFPIPSMPSRLPKQVSFTSEPEEIRQTSLRTHMSASFSLPSTLKKKSATWPQPFQFESHSLVGTWEISQPLQEMPFRFVDMSQEA